MKAIRLHEFGRLEVLVEAAAGGVGTLLATESAQDEAVAGRLQPVIGQRFPRSPAPLTRTRRWRRARPSARRCST